MPRTIDLAINTGSTTLQLRLRPSARVAAAGSLPDLQRLLRLANGDRDSDETRLFLPVFYAPLDSRRIPNPNQLDTLNDGVVTQIANALCSLEHLGILKPIPLDATSILWNSAWKWIQFLHNYWACIPALFDTFTLVVRQDPEVATDMYKTLGLRVILTRAWKLLLHEPEEQTRFPALQEVCTFLSAMPENPNVRHYAFPVEFLDSAGSPSHSASLSIMHLERYTTRPHPAYSPLFLLSILLFTTETRINGPFLEVLLTHGVVATFTRTACAFLDGRLENCVLKLHDLIFGYLTPIFMRPMVEIFGSCTVYYSVLSSMEPALRDVQKLQTKPAFTESRLFKKWSEFWDLAQERITTMKWYESDEFVFFKACDMREYPPQARPRPLRLLQQVAVLLLQAIPVNRVEGPPSRRLPSYARIAPDRDRSFLRALLDIDYKASQATILHWQLAFMHEFPNDTPCLRFDYTRGRPHFRFTRASELGAAWADDVALATRSGGRVALHAVLVTNCEIDVIRVFPMQSSSTALEDGLRLVSLQLCELLRDDDPELDEEKQNTGGARKVEVKRTTFT
ncbi:hypothetical protein DFH09DRAFT_1095870 [Mycena vulgaris]|nr:hypothetical protein DFH09DRAFT_1095870 [Mycena vulgaris]